MTSDRDIAREALRRVEGLSHKHAARRRTLLSASAAAAALILVVGVSLLIPNAVPSGITKTSLGVATLSTGEAAGGYVLVGVIAFVLGVVVTIFCLRQSGNKP